MSEQVESLVEAVVRRAAELHEEWQRIANNAAWNVFHSPITSALAHAITEHRFTSAGVCACGVTIERRRTHYGFEVNPQAAADHIALAIMVWLDLTGVSHEQIAAEVASFKSQEPTPEASRFRFFDV